MYLRNISVPLSCGGRYNGETDGQGQVAVQKPIKQAAGGVVGGELRIKFS